MRVSAFTCGHLVPQELDKGVNGSEFGSFYDLWTGGQSFTSQEDTLGAASVGA